MDLQQPNDDGLLTTPELLNTHKEIYYTNIESLIYNSHNTLLFDFYNQVINEMDN